MEKIDGLFVAASVVAIILAAIGAFGIDIWLASTQWILVAAVLGIYALYFKK